MAVAVALAPAIAGGAAGAAIAGSIDVDALRADPKRAEELARKRKEAER